jgi:hypothetical protein
VAQALPELQLLDRQPLDDEREHAAQEQGLAAQHIAELQLQAYQPQSHLSCPAAEHQDQNADAAERLHNQAYSWPMPITIQGPAQAPQMCAPIQCMQQLPGLTRVPGSLPEVLGREDVQNLADRLAQRLAQSRSLLPEEVRCADSAKQEQRWASMEARLAALLEGRLPVPDQTQAAQASDYAQPGLSQEQSGVTVAGMLPIVTESQQPVSHGSRCSLPQTASRPVLQLQVRTAPAA